MLTASLTRLVGRVVQGIGGGGILALGEILVTDLVPLEVRGLWLGIIGECNITG